MMKLLLFMVILCPTVVLIASVVCCIMRSFFKQRKVIKTVQQDVNQLKSRNIVAGRRHLKIYKYEDIKTATIDFNNRRIIGEGGFCTVYKAFLFGRLVAVKKLNALSSVGLAQLENEVELLGGLQHKNVVRLIGYCCHQQELILVYEFLANQNLEHFLSVQTSKVLDWNERYNIIKGVANGLMYLHRGARKTVIHKDVKCSNILLDDNMSPLICDFGTSRCFTGMGDGSGVSENIFATIGYSDPETFHGKYSTKTDVFSFGVVVLRILNGKATHTSTSDHITNTAWDIWKEGDILMFKDIRMGVEFDEAEFKRSFLIALWCVQEDASKRPEMLKVVDMLNSNLMPEAPKDHPPSIKDILSI